MLDHDKKCKDAQNRESKSSQELENVPGNKGKIEIDIPNNPKLHLTADMMEIDQSEKLITLLEGKNSSNKKFPDDTMIYEQIVKLILLKNCDFKLFGIVLGSKTMKKIKQDPKRSKISEVFFSKIPTFREPYRGF